MADLLLDEKCEQLMNVVVDTRKKFGKMCVEYEMKASLVENQMLNLQLETISNHRFKPKHTVPTELDDTCKEIENFTLEIMQRQQKMENLKRRLKATQEVVLQMKNDNVASKLMEPVTADVMLARAKLKNLK